MIFQKKLQKGKKALTATKIAVRALVKKLFLHNLQDFHGAGLHANAAGDALGGGALLGGYHNLHGTYLYALTAGGTQLLVDHVNAGLGILGDGTGLANLGTFATLDAGHGLDRIALLHNLDAGKVLVEFLVESVGAGTDALQASHALGTLFDGKFLHKRKIPFFIYFFLLYRIPPEIAMAIFRFLKKYVLLAIFFLSWLKAKFSGIIGTFQNITGG